MSFFLTYGFEPSTLYNYDMLLSINELSKTYFCFTMFNFMNLPCLYVMSLE